MLNLLSFFKGRFQEEIKHANQWDDLWHQLIQAVVEPGKYDQGGRVMLKLIGEGQILEK